MTHLEKCLTIYNMPELPEVETICRALKRNIKSREISNFKIFNKNLRWKISNKIKLVAKTDASICFVRYLKIITDK